MAANSTSTIYRKDNPRLDGTNYGVWKIQMETHLRFIGKEIWEITQKG